MTSSSTSATRRMSLLPGTLNVGFANCRWLTWRNCETSIGFVGISFVIFGITWRLVLTTLLSFVAIKPKVFCVFAGPRAAIGVCTFSIGSISAFALASVMKLACEPESSSARIENSLPALSRRETETSCWCVAVTIYNGFVVFLFCFSARCFGMNLSFSRWVCLQVLVAMQKSKVLHFTLSAGILRGTGVHAMTKLQTIERYLLWSNEFGSIRNWHIFEVRTRMNIWGAEQDSSRHWLLKKIGSHGLVLGY